MAEIDALTRLQKFVDQFETQQEAATALGIKPSYLSDLVHMRRDISDNILKKLGLRRQIVQDRA